MKLARAHTRVADSRRDWHHKESTRIIRDNQAVYVADLAVSGLARGRLSKSVHDAGWSAFVAMLEYKATKHGRVCPDRQVRAHHPHLFRVRLVWAETGVVGTDLPLPRLLPGGRSRR